MVNRDAPVVARDAILIRAPIQVIWSWEGAPVSANPEAMRSALDASLRAWLENLRRAAENRAR